MSSRRFRCSSAAAAVCCLAGAAAAQPANDLCDNAAVASIGANPGTLINASAETSANSCDDGGNDVFFSFVPPATGAYVLSLCQDDVFFDSVLSIHTACPATVGNEVACDDDGCGFFADLSRIADVTLTGGQTYFIRVSTYGSADIGDTFILNIATTSTGACCLIDGNCIPTNGASCTGLYRGDGTACTPNPCPPLGTCCSTDQCCTIAFESQCTGVWTSGGTCNPTPCVVPANDACSGAAVLTLGMPQTGSNCSAGDDQTLSCAFSGPANTRRTVWFAFTPAHTAAYSFNACGSSFDTLLGVFSGDCGSLVEIACNDDSTSTGNVVCPGGTILAQLNSRIPSVLLNAGETYRVLLAAWGTGTPGGSYILNAGAVGALGACCQGDACTQTDEPRCTGGTFTAGSLCNPNPCLPATGACCEGSTCSIAPVAECTGQFRRFAGLGTVCNAYSATDPSQNRSPCCLADFNQTAGTTEPTVQDIFDFINAFFNNDPRANINGTNNPIEPTVQDIFDYLNAYFNACSL
ncbi:MAG: hypothetical protein ACK4WH_02295 [Phycisphaerales bacterium]